MLRFAVPVALIAGSVALFDLVAYFAVPPAYTAFASSYRKTRLLTGPLGQPAMTRGGDPRYYFRPDDTMGFDIAPGMRMAHDFNAVPHEIFSSSLACFDANELAALREAREYVYFGGDSFTWGFADYDSKFATVWERAKGRPAAKCGVPHTGQAAQFEKFRRVAATIGKLPAVVFVGYYVNDPANDAAYPHTTVMHGYMVDTAYDQGGVLVHPEVGAIRQVVEASLAELERPRTALEQAKTYVWVYSLSANIADHLLRKALEPAPAATRPAGGSARGAPDVSPRPTSRFGANLYYWYDPGTMKTRFADDPKTAANREAILRWARHAKASSYRIVFLLFPPKDAFDDADFFGQVKQFLDANGIEHLDFAPLFRAGRFKVNDLYWDDNGHWNEAGNRAVGRLLAERY